MNYRYVLICAAIAAVLSSAACTAPTDGAEGQKQAAPSTSARTSDDDAPRFPDGAPYASVRAELLRTGYAAAPQTRDEFSSAMCGARDGEPDLCVVYPEVVTCGSGGQVRPCVFLFERKSDGRRLNVGTEGDRTTRLTVSMVDWSPPGPIGAD